MIFELVKLQASPRRHLDAGERGRTSSSRSASRACRSSRTASVAGWDDHEVYAQRIRNYTAKPIERGNPPDVPGPRRLPQPAQADAARLPDRRIHGHGAMPARRPTCCSRSSGTRGTTPSRIRDAGERRRSMLSENVLECAPLAWCQQWGVARGVHGVVREKPTIGNARVAPSTNCRRPSRGTSRQRTLAAEFLIATSALGFGPSSRSSRIRLPESRHCPYSSAGLPARRSSRPHPEGTPIRGNSVRLPLSLFRFI